MGRREGKFGMRNYVGSSQNLGEANKGLGEAPKAARGRSMKARPTQSRGGLKGQLPLAGVKGQRPLWVWGNAPLFHVRPIPKEAANKGAGSEASLPVTLRVRRRATKLLFPQDSVKNQNARLAQGAVGRRVIRFRCCTSCTTGAACIRRTGGCWALHTLRP